MIRSNTDDYYNSFDLNNIFNDDILDEWIREEEKPMSSPDDLGWLNESIRRSDESGGDDGGYRRDGGNDEETHGVGGSQQGGAMTWDSDYYTTQDTNHRGWPGVSQ